MRDTHLTVHPASNHTERLLQPATFFRFDGLMFPIGLYNLHSPEHASCYCIGCQETFGRMTYKRTP